jgi:hypothetical protein
MAKTYGFSDEYSSTDAANYSSSGSSSGSGATDILGMIPIVGSYFTSKASTEKTQGLNRQQYNLIAQEVSKGGTIDQAIAKLREFGAERTKFYGGEIGRKTGLDLYDVKQKTDALTTKSGFSSSGAINRLQGSTLDEVLGNAFSSMYEMQLGERMKMYEQESALEGTRRSMQVTQAGMDIGSNGGETQSMAAAAPWIKDTQGYKDIQDYMAKKHPGEVY